MDHSIFSPDEFFWATLQYNPQLKAPGASKSMQKMSEKDEMTDDSRTKKELYRNDIFPYHFDCFSVYSYNPGVHCVCIHNAE